MTSEDHNFHPTYRPDIDGLRAIAILSVVAFHAFPSSFKGGHVGVDVFFVISGYLISCIIFKSLRGGSFSFSEFYAHRVNRLSPALIFVLLISYAFGSFSLFPDEFRQLGKHITAGAGFVQNFVLWQEAGYFDKASLLKPMMHLWSLSIEEQFYLIYPVLIWGAWRLRLNIFTTVILLGLGSFGLNVHAVDTEAAKAFFVPQTRFWELLVGAVLAYLQVVRQVKLEEWLAKSQRDHSLLRFLLPQKWPLRSILSIVGFMLIIVAVFGINKNKAFPGWWALLPVFGAFFLILAGPAALLNRKILASRLMVFFGLISYPLYLWHWPIFSFARIIENQTPSLTVRLCLVFVSILMAWITYRFVEKPIRSGIRTRSKTAALSLSMLLIMGLGYITYLGYTPWRAPAQNEILLFEHAKTASTFPPRSFTAGNSDKLVFWTHDGLSTTQKTLFLGDSNIGQYGPRIEKVILESTEPANGAVIVSNQLNCDILGSVLDAHGCQNQIQELLRIARDENIKKLVIAASWGKYEQSFEDAGKRINLADFLNQLSSGKQIYIIRNIPVDPENLPVDSIINRRLSVAGGKLEFVNRSSPMETYKTRFGSIDMALQKIAGATNATLISPTDYWCVNDSCPARDNNGYPIYMDSGHITASFSRTAAIFIDQTLDPNDEAVINR
jgi:peptidoglycan/LPS O-acetylase OafA/YrhL